MDVWKHFKIYPAAKFQKSFVIIGCCLMDLFNLILLLFPALRRTQSAGHTANFISRSGRWSSHQLGRGMLRRFWRNFHRRLHGGRALYGGRRRRRCWLHRFPGFKVNVLQHVVSWFGRLCINKLWSKMMAWMHGFSGIGSLIKVSV